MYIFDYLINKSFSDSVATFSNFHGKLFYEIVNNRIEELGMKESNKKLIEVTQLSSSICSKLKNDKAYNPNMNTIVALCIGLKLSFEETEYLLKQKGYAFSPEIKAHHAYTVFLKFYRLLGWGVNECNKLLVEWNIDKKYYLGSFDIDEEL